MAIIEVHVHNHVDTREILHGISAVRVDIAKLLALAAAASDADRAEILKAAAGLDQSTGDLKATTDANPVPK